MSEIEKEQQQIISETEVKEVANPQFSNNSKEETMIVRNIDQVNKLLDAARIMSGQKTTDQLQEEMSQQLKEDPNEDIEHNKVILPSELFKDFPYVAYDNEKDFDYLVGTIIIQFLEKFNDKALEFPPCLDGAARAKIHALCNFLGLKSHSQGMNACKRRILIYPRHLFPKKQEKENERIQREKDKIREKFKDFTFIGVPKENAITKREKFIREIYYESKGLSDPQKEEVWEGPTEVRIVELKKKIEVHESNMKKVKLDYEKEEEKKKESEEIKRQSKFEETIESVGSDGKKKPKIIKYVGNSEQKNNEDSLNKNEDKDAKQEGKGDDVDSDLDIDSDEHDDEYFTMTAEQKKAYKQKQERIKKQQQEEYKKREQFKKQLKETTLESFKDKPEEVKMIRCLHSESHTVAFEWDPPVNNNSPITMYHVYLSSKKVTTKRINKFQEDVVMEQNTAPQLVKVASTTETYFDLLNLESDTCYYIIVTAENEHGEGYKSQNPFMMKTTVQDFSKEAYSVYCWGNNTSSELGLADEQVQENSQFYVKHAMKKPLKNSMFEANGGVLQVAPGNASTVFLFLDKQSNTQSVIQSGITTILNDGEPQKDQSVFRKNDIQKLQDIPSLPFQVDFNIPVVKVTCGDLFAGLVTAEGEVYTWGYNLHGQLGVKDSTIIVALQPQRVTFPQPKDHIIDLCVGFNHCLALNENKQVYVWGRRMGIYPQFEFTYYAIQNEMQHMLNEINQDSPRLLKGNLIYYKIDKIRAGPGNSALITENEEVLLQGMNDFGQLAIGEELGKILYFFAEFMKKDWFKANGLRVIDIQYGLFHTLILCYDDEKQKHRVFGCGHTEFGQLGSITNVITHQLIELTEKIPGEVVQISAGSFHSLFLTKDKKLFGFGKNSKGQLGFKGKKQESQSTEIKIDNGKSEIMSIHSGSLFSMCLARKLQ